MACGQGVFNGNGRRFPAPVNYRSRYAAWRLGSFQLGRTQWQV